MTKEEITDIENAARKAYHWPSPGQTEQDREVIASMAKLFDEIARLNAKVEKLENEKTLLERRMHWDRIDRSQPEDIVRFK
jgi:hypothetical protein